MKIELGWVECFSFKEKVAGSIPVIFYLIKKNKKIGFN